MAITTLLDPALLPARTMDQAAFDAAMAYLMTNLPTWGAQTNALQANLNSIAYGGAYAIQYKYTAAASVGAGNSSFAVRATDASQSVAGQIYLDKTSFGTTVTALLDQFTVSSSASKGTVRVVKQSDVTKWVIYNISSVTDFGTYYAFNVTAVGASSANPFVVNDAVMLLFQRTGDKGDAGSITPVLWVRDEKASGTAGGSAGASTYVTRTLNTTKKNSISGASVASNQITLPAGTYRISFSAPAYNVAGHQAYFYNVTDASTAVLGSTATTVGTGPQTRSEAFDAEITIMASKLFELRHWTNTGTASTGLGYMASTGQNEVYSDLFIEKVS